MTGQSSISFNMLLYDKISLAQPVPAIRKGDWTRGVVWGKRNLSVGSDIMYGTVRDGAIVGYAFRIFSSWSYATISID